MTFEDEEETSIGHSVDAPLVRPCFEVIESRDSSLVGRVFPIGAGLSIGRRDSADLRLLDRSVSRDHARLLVAGEDITLIDLGTTNGTFVNGNPTQRAVLQVGDMVRIGLHTVFRFARDTTRWSLRLTDALIAARIALWEWDSTTATVFTSRNFAQVTGLTGDLPDDPVELLDLVHPDDRDRAAAAVRASVESDEAFEIEVRLSPRVNGSDVWLAIKGHGNRLPDSVTVSGSVANTSSRKRAERELRRLTQVLENMYDAIVVLDLEARVTDWTSKAEHTFGLARDEALGSALADLVGKDHVLALQRETAAHGHYNAEIRIESARERAGDPGAVYEVAAGPLKDDDGFVIGYVAAFRDVTEKKALQEQMVLADKMAAIGTLAASIAHEINNPLAFVVGGLDWLAERVGTALIDRRDGDTPSDVLDEMRQGVARIATIVGSMKTLSRKDDHPTPAPVDLRRAVALAERIVSNEVRQWARLRIDIPSGVHVLGNETRLMQVFINLLMNAVHAIQSGTPSRNAIRVAIERQDPDEVTVIVRDTGCGMSANTLERAFTPFFTTKPAGMGTGLGLSVTRTIVEGSGGTIAIESTQDVGTTVRLRLPLAAGVAVAVPAPAPAPLRPPAAAPNGSTGAVLIVDDEPMVANALCRLLRSRGYLVESAPDGRTGVALARTGKFDAIVCDLMMPGFSGVDLHDELAAERPELLDRLLFLSGGAFSPREQAFVEEGRRAVLAKPWSADGIVAAIAAVVARTIAARGAA